MSYELRIAGLPPSLNTTMRHWSNAYRARKDWYERIAVHALGRKIPRPAFASAIVEVEVHYARRRRDAGNVEKVALDALVKCGILLDDSFPALAETRLRARPAAEDCLVLIVRDATDAAAPR